MPTDAEARIMERLMLHGPANAYELKIEEKVRYATPFEALRRLEEKGLVRLVEPEQPGRRHAKPYGLTLAGLILTLGDSDPRMFIQEGWVEEIVEKHEDLLPEIFIPWRRIGKKYGAIARDALRSAVLGTDAWMRTGWQRNRPRSFSQVYDFQLHRRIPIDQFFKRELVELMTLTDKAAKSWRDILDKNPDLRTVVANAHTDLDLRIWKTLGLLAELLLFRDKINGKESDPMLFEWVRPWGKAFQAPKGEIELETSTQAIDRIYQRLHKLKQALPDSRA